MPVLELAGKPVMVLSDENPAARPTGPRRNPASSLLLWNRLRLREALRRGLPV